MSESVAPEPQNAPDLEVDIPLPDASGVAAVEDGNGAASKGARARQMLGMKGAEVGDRSVWQIHLQLMKPVTWIPLMWGVVCGAASSGGYEWTWECFAQSMACMLMSGPLLAGYTQTLNDYYDREIDAINEPYRPIPSGAISLQRVIAQIWLLLLLGLGLAFGLDVWAAHEFPIMTVLAAFGIFVAYIYSAPPLKLKQNGWLGNYALGSSYIALPWWAGHALFGQLNATVIAITLIYSLAGLGIAVVNDFKSVEGDRELGLQSLPVVFGVQKAAWISVTTIDVFQISMAIFLVVVGQNLLATLIVFLVIPQIVLQDMYFLRDPVANDVKYQASAQPFLVLGMLVMAFGMARAGI
ncbi:chlorophyll synthase ChlG [Synechococcus sp. PCC 7336]|uniref:chlorophyll synthase ChlG n=1 Tax=Synechococcus sp. PCC 7336 TaxID=195250 RepID=UPI0003606A35|nr:chlorophyll synthase ChlG [Synechococcus sp. PCC 7336]